VESLVNTEDPVTIEIETKSPMKRKMLISKVAEGVQSWYGTRSKKSVRAATRTLKAALKSVLPVRLMSGVKLRFDM